MQGILKSVLFAAAFAFAASSCKDPNTRQSLLPEQIGKIHQFVGELNKSLNHFEFDFVKKAWSHDLFKRRIGRLGNTGHGVFNHIYETSIKSYILNFNLNLMVFAKYKSLGQIIYQEYGVEFLSIYLAHFFIVGLFLLWCNNKTKKIVGLLEDEIDRI